MAQVSIFMVEDLCLNSSSCGKGHLISTLWFHSAKTKSLEIAVLNLISLKQSGEVWDLWKTNSGLWFPHHTEGKTLAFRYYVQQAHINIGFSEEWSPNPPYSGRHSAERPT
ncbi:hypothetical protein AVEN_128021-1 [Araneus ventricosus]|uniref:Uncharacterized protein n=1 Tax=Araneus ventricosus TaxID=182803 RepID=A0A4Y2A193_ARAVE|nr:hypothetical protein AVEN_128021-1 [Araneus ventricosus]